LNRQVSPDTFPLDRRNLPLIKHRRVIYVHGYDPQGAVGYYRLFEHAWKVFKKTWGVESNLSPLKIESNDVASWTIVTTAPDWQVRTDYEFVRYEDILEQNLKQPMVGQIFAALRWMFGDLFSGATARVIRASWRFEIHHAAFQLGLLAWIGLSVAAGVSGALAVRNYLGLPLWAQLPIGVAVAALAFYGLRPLAERWFIIRINNHWPILRQYGRGEPTCFERPIETAVARLLAAVNARDVDEILLIGHSGGGPMVLPIMARALDRDPDLGRRGARVAVLTLGSIMPGVAVDPRARWMRDMVRRIAIEPSVRWIDCQSRKDILNFWDFDPVTDVGVDAGPQRCNPLVWPIRMRDIISDERYRRIRRSFFRVHYQFIMAADRRSYYGFAMLVCGPYLAEDWAQRGRQLAWNWSPLGARKREADEGAASRFA
jgi:hypothetical protein